MTESRPFHLSSLGESVRNRLAVVQGMVGLTGTVGDTARQVTGEAEAAQTPEQAFASLLTVQRLFLTRELRIENNTRIKNGFARDVFPAWSDYISVDMRDESKEKLAKALYEGDPEQRTPVLLMPSDYSRGVAEKILNRCVVDQVESDVWIDDPVFDHFILSLNDMDVARRHGALRALPREKAGRRITFNLNAPHFDFERAPKDILNAHTSAFKDRINRYSRGLMFTATRIPTLKNAQLDGVSHAEALENFADLCGENMQEKDVPHAYLEHRMNAADIIHIQNNEGTNLFLSIGHFDAVDSRTARNVPGSEMFTGVERESVQGVLHANRKYLMPFTDQLIEDIHLEFKNGRVNDFDARIGRQILQEFFDMDENHRYLCEFALNTNMAYTGWTTNSMLVEKAGGKIHFGFGKTYQNRAENGKTFRLDNGNQAQYHVDVALPMADTQGSICFDGEYIMQDGLYLHSALKSLNGPR